MCSLSTPQLNSLAPSTGLILVYQSLVHMQFHIIFSSSQLMEMRWCNSYLCSSHHSALTSQVIIIVNKHLIYAMHLLTQGLCSQASVNEPLPPIPSTAHLAAWVWYRPVLCTESVNQRDSVVGTVAMAQYT